MPKLSKSIKKLLIPAYLLTLILAIGLTTSQLTTDIQAQRPLKYYGVDFVSPEDLATLSQYNINTVIAALDVGNSPSSWQAYFTEAEKYNIGVVVIPTDWNNPRPNCSWGAPYHGDDISAVKPMLDAIGGHDKLIGIFNAHEALGKSCPMTIQEMASIRTKLKNYIQNKHGREIKVWNYIDNIYDRVPSGAIDKIMDVAVTWQHCINGAEGSCEDARTRILNDRDSINNAGLNGTVELIYLFQTFAKHGTKYGQMPTANEMYDWGCNFLNTGTLDGFFWYTWGADWYSEDLDDNSDLWPSMNNVYNDCVIQAGSSPTPTSTPGPSSTPGPTSTPVPQPTHPVLEENKVTPTVMIE